MMVAERHVIARAATFGVQSTAHAAAAITFALNVLAGYVLTVLGALIGLAAGVWWMRAGEWARDKPPAAFRALGTLAFLCFIVGPFWQLAGYLRIEYTRGW